MSSTKDQALDGLWPEVDPDIAANSLNQTLYFLRRVFDPAYKEGISADYVKYEQDVIWLDQELVSSRSRRAIQALDGLDAHPSNAQLWEVLREYTGPFALDFAYDEWAASFRDALHIRFLEGVERLLIADLQAGGYEEAIALARAALAVERDADQLEVILVRLLRLSGSTVAAAEQYEHYARVMRSGLGVEPPPFDSA
jgi:DNA-binding SARP family transcriptional activator